MGLCTPIDAIYEWLDNEKLGHVLHSRPVQRLDLGSFASPPR
jgi:hypothetical protein